MDIRALLFDVNGTLIDIETDEGLEEIYRAIAHFLTYQGISLHRWEVRDLYFQIMQQQRAQSAETFAECDVVEVWREFLRQQGQRLHPLSALRKARAASAVSGGTAPGHCPQAAPSLSSGARDTRPIALTLPHGSSFRRPECVCRSRIARGGAAALLQPYYRLW